MNTRAWEVARGILIVVVSTAIISVAVSLYRIASDWPFFGGVPDGAVIPFDLATCPAGWNTESRAEGRFIIGTGVHSDFNSHGTAVAPKTLGQEGGDDQVQLAIEHMPRHTHANPTQGGTPTSNFPALRATDNGFRGADSMPHGRPTSARGGGLPHDNMPPFLALQFCKKG